MHVISSIKCNVSRERREEIFTESKLNKLTIFTFIRNITEILLLAKIFRSSSVKKGMYARLI